MQGFPAGSDGKESAWNVEELGLIPESGRSPGGGHCNPLQYSRLQNPMDKTAWWATVHRVAELNTTEATEHTHTHTHIHTHTLLWGFLSSQASQKCHT